VPTRWAKLCRAYGAWFVRRVDSAEVGGASKPAPFAEKKSAKSAAPGKAGSQQREVTNRGTG